MSKYFLYNSHPAHVGKSRSIKAIFFVLKSMKERGEIDLEYKVLAGSDDIENKEDLKVLICYKGKKIGLESQGDPNSRLISSIREFVEDYKCDIIISACRTKGKDLKVVKELCKDYTSIACPSFVYRTHDQRTINTMAEGYAKRIIDLVNALIST